MTKSYSNYLTDVDRVFVQYVTKPRRGRPALVVRYYVRYEFYNGNAWVPVIEYDNCHGPAHQHDYTDRKKGPAKILGPGTNPKEEYEVLYKKMCTEYEKYKEWYNHR